MATGKKTLMTLHNDTAEQIAPPRIEYLKIQNFRALRDVEFDRIAPMTVLLGPNGSGKSTVFDVFGFLSECFDSGLRRAWDRRGKAKELKTHGSDGPLTIEVKYREQPKQPLMAYHISIDEVRGSPVVMEEWLRWRRGRYGAPFKFLEYRHGVGRAVSGEQFDSRDLRVENSLGSPDLLAVNALGWFAEHPRVAALRDFITGWHVSHLSASGYPESDQRERLTDTGDSLANVIRYLSEQYPERLERIFAALRRRVPRIERVLTEMTLDGRLLLQIKDAPFTQPTLARFASDGTLKMLTYLTLLYGPHTPPFIGIKEPENFLHPRLLHELAEECRVACERAQMLIATHSPFFINALAPNEVRVLWRDEKGYTQTSLVQDIRGVPEFVEEGAMLGQLWMEGHFGVGDPLARQDSPVNRPGMGDSE